MRCAAIGFTLLLAGTCQAQVSTTGTSVWGGAPRNITFTPIDTSKAVGPSSNLSKAFKMPSATSATNKPFNLTNMMPSISLPSWPPKTPQVSVLPQTQNIYQPTPPKGAVNLFNYPKKK
jgi:hypothetical protein